MTTLLYSYIVMLPLLLLVQLSEQVHGFSIVSSKLPGSSNNNNLISKRPTALFLSDIPSPQETERRFELPPPPEDHLVLTGDLLSLAVYGFTDHFLCNDMALMMMRDLDSPQKLYEAAASAPSSGGVFPASDWGAPVWLDSGSSFSSHVLQVTLQDRLVASYSPLLEPVGLATCLLATCWLIAGWWHRAFQFPNSVACTTTRALAKTAQTWLTCTVLMLGIVSMSHMLDNNVTTKGDLDYILGSLTCLSVWRFMISYMLGTGQDSDGF
jgi:hypothetical protein